MNRKTLTIGIPALNEEDNIGRLIASLLQQQFNGVELDLILVISDGSTDDTVKIVRKFASSRVKVIAKKKRQGAMATQNAILRHSNSDILVMLDADVLPIGKYFIAELIKPILNNAKIGIVGADTVSIKGSHYFEQVISSSHEFKKSIYVELNEGNNLYLCHGRARAFSKRFYKSLKWVEEGPEDAFSYLSCIDKGFKFVFAPKAKVLFKSPTNFSDHAKQSVRFEHGKTNIEKYFDKQLIFNAYKIPHELVIKKLTKYLIKDTLKCICYIALKLYIDNVVGRQKVNLSTWEVASSSKKLV